ncbi:MAG TPA: TlpA disulfide reductase family protein [Burkholderiales bacterium]|jgi:thiol-disulfide isomerase/thioredoxin|nr:TlpA disulfide reductase family protein [Burkholderiales bacterium]
MSHWYRLLAVLGLACALGVEAAPLHELRPFTASSLDAIREARAGKPFVLAFWSIHCEPCREEMAQWKSLQRKYPGLPIVLVSTDLPVERTRVTEFLSRYDPGRVETWIFADEFGERVRYAVDRTWRGELPRTYLYDAAHRPETRSGRFDKNWIESWFARQGAASRPRQP